jgi:ABC-type spermidine/putrescine transport system permease subunit I
VAAVLQFSVVLAFVHLYTMFMIVPIFNSMMRIDRSLLEAASDAAPRAGRRCGTWWCRCRAPAS